MSNEYDNWNSIIENTGRYFFVNVRKNWNEYYNRIVNLSEQDLIQENKKISEIDALYLSHKERMNYYLDNIREKRQLAVQVYDNYRSTKVPYSLYEKIYTYKRMGKNIPAKDADVYNNICEKRESYLNEAKKLWKEIYNLEKEYAFFMNGKSDYLNSLNREKKYAQNRIFYEFNKDLKKKLLGDKEKIDKILESDEMIKRFSFFIRKICLSVYPSFFNNLSEMDREEIASYFFNSMISKYERSTNIEFVRLLYKEGENGNILNLLSVDTVANGTGSPLSSCRTALSVLVFCAKAIDRVDITPTKTAKIFLKFIQ